MIIPECDKCFKNLENERPLLRIKDHIFRCKKCYKINNAIFKKPSMEEFLNDWYHTITDSYPW